MRSRFFIISGALVVIALLVTVLVWLLLQGVFIKQGESTLQVGNPVITEEQNPTTLE